MRIICILLVLSLLIPGQLFSQSDQPDRVVFSSYRPQGWDIFLSDKSTGELEQITFDDALDYNPLISPDGKWLVFTSERQGNPDLFIKNLEEDTPPQLLVKGDDSMQDQATISPDNKWLVFTSTHENNSDIYRLPFQAHSTLSIQDAKNLTQHKGGDFRPSFSPDGSRIVFSSDRKHPIKTHPRFVFAMTRTADIYSMDLEGQNLIRITQNESWDGSPTYSKSGDLIYFYSQQGESFRICSVNPVGGNQKILTPEDYDAVSPIVLNDSSLIFTTWEGRDFRLMSFNLKSGETSPLFDTDKNLVGAKAAKDGRLAIYGGLSPEDQAINLGGFSGDILVKGSPYSKILNGQAIDFYGIRRAFAAPPRKAETTVIFDHTEVSGIQDVFTNWAYLLILIPILYLILLIRGNGRLRKSKAKLSSHVSFSLLVLTQVLLLGGMLYFFYMVERVSINSMRMYLAAAALICLIGIGLSQISKANLLVSQLKNSLLLSLLSSLLLILILPQIIQIPVQFYKADYLTKEVNLIYDFVKPSNYNPFNGRVIDTKLSPSGEKLIYTVGSFRGGPKDQGDVFSLDLQSFQAERISDSDFNDGFGDISDDQSRFVFRSGRSGDFDIYVKENGSIQNLTNDTHRDNFPIISPQGDKIVFCSDRFGTDIEGKVKTMDIFLFELNEKQEWEGPIRLTDDPGQDAHPHFSPDGEWVIYSSEEGGINDEEPLVKPIIFGPQIYGEIFALNLASREKIRLTHNKWEDGAPLWTKGE